MAYLHCHTKGCGWSQDDFWHRRYNPLTKLWSDIRWLWLPRMIRINTEGGIHPRIFSWHALLLEVKKEIRNILHMKWWTYKSFMKERNTALCPKCGKSDFDID